MATIEFFPDGQGYSSYDSAVSINSVDKWLEVDESSADDDTSYIYRNSANFQQSFSVNGNCPAGATAIDLTVICRLKKTTSSTSGSYVDIHPNRSDTTNNVNVWNGANTTTYSTKTTNFLTNPWTAADWTVAEINGTGTAGQSLMAISAVSTAIGAGEECRFTQLKCICTYTPDAGGGDPSGAVIFNPYDEVIF